MTRRRNSRRTINRNTGIESLEPRELLAITIFQGPSPQVRAEDTSAVFGPGFSSDSSFYLDFFDSSAVDVFTDTVTVQIEAFNGGILTAPTRSDFTTTGNGTGNISISGPVWIVRNFGINSITLSPVKDFVGITSARVKIISGTDNATASATLTLQSTAVNDPPIINGPATALKVPFNGSLSFGGNRRIRITDVDATNADLGVILDSSPGLMTLATTEGLNFLTGDGESDSWMRFEGSREAVNSALDGLMYRPPLNASGTGGIRVIANDGLGSDRTFGITILPNVPPFLGGLAGTASFTENAGSTRVAPNATLTDADSANFSGGTLTVTIAANRSNSDVLSVLNQTPGAGRITVSGNVVSYSGIEIGNASGGTNDSPLIVNLNSNATPTSVQALIRNIAFRVISENPKTAVRTVRFTVADGDGGTSRPATRQINVVAVNDPPVIRNITGTVSYTRGKAPIRIAAAALVSDVDQAHFNGGVLTINYLSGSNSRDRLSLLGYLVDSTGRITRNGKLIGTKNSNGGVGITRLSIRLTTSATAAEVQLLLRSILFETTATSTANRVLEFTLGDGSGGTSSAVRRTVRVL